MSTQTRHAVGLQLATSSRDRWRPRLPTKVGLVGADLLVGVLYLVVDPGHLATYLLNTAVVIVLFATGGLYRARLHLSLLDDLPAMTGRLLLALAVVGAFLALTNVAPSVEFGIVAGLGAVAHVVLRGVVLAVVRAGRKRGLVRHRTLLVGGGELTGELVRTLRLNPQYGLDPIGCVDTLPPVVETSSVVPWLGTTSEIDTVATKHGASIVLVAFGGDREAEIVELIRQRTVSDREVFIVPRMFEMDVRKTPGDHIGVVPVVRLPRRAVKGPRWRMKRAFDVAVSGLALLVLSPILIAAAIAVRLEGGPGIIFRQERIGRDGIPFEIFKFRSMKPVAPGAGDTTWSIAGNNRVGKVGKFIRATSVDELPQLWNILRGDMTIVGPRPERPHFVEQFSAQYPIYTHRHRVPAGLTGLAQVSGLRGDTSIGDRAKYDNFYIESWSFWLDLKVILRTVGEVFRGGGRN